MCFVVACPRLSGGQGHACIYGDLFFEIRVILILANRLDISDLVGV